MPKLVLLIESNTSGTGRLFARAARTLGYEPVLISHQPDCYPYATEDGIRTVAADTGDMERLESVVRHLERTEGVAGVLSSSEYFVVTASRLARGLGLPAPDPEAVAFCRDKASQRKRLAAAGLDDVQHAVVASVPDAVLAAHRLGWPVVLKPVAASGSVGVRLCSTPDDVAAHAGMLLGTEVGGRILVEEFVAGPEYSVEVFDGAVVGITAKHVGAPPYFVEIGHEFPAPLEDGAASAISRFAAQVVHALGLTWGPVHVELRAAGDRLHIMEVNPRLAGGFIPELVRHATGIDLVLETVRLATGGTPDFSQNSNAAAAIRFLVPGEDGVLTGIEGVDVAVAVPGVRDVRLYRPLPCTVARRGDFQDRLGHVLATAPTVSDAVAAAKAALGAIHLHTAEVNGTLTVAA